MTVTPIAKLPVWRTTVETYRLTWKTFCELFRYVWPWLALWIVADTAISWLNWPFLERSNIVTQNSPSRIFLSIVTTLSLLPICFGSIVAVPWHRRLLLGELSETKSFAAVRKNVRPYFVTALLLSFAASAPALVVDLFGPSPGATSDALNRGTVLILTAALFWMLTSFFTTRIFLTLPARALGDATLRFRDVWKRTTGNMWRLSFAGFLSAVLWLPVGVIAALLQSDPQTRWESTIANCVIDIIAIVLRLSS